MEQKSENLDHSTATNLVVPKLDETKKTSKTTGDELGRILKDVPESYKPKGPISSTMHIGAEERNKPGHFGPQHLKAKPVPPIPLTEGERKDALAVLDLIAEGMPTTKEMSADLPNVRDRHLKWVRGNSTRERAYTNYRKRDKSLPNIESRRKP